MNLRTNDSRYFIHYSLTLHFVQKRIKAVSLWGGGRQGCNMMSRLNKKFVDAPLAHAYLEG